MTLTFGAESPERFIDCGHITAQVGGRAIDMPYAAFLPQEHRATLQGRMNLLARADGDGRTTVRVTSRYVFSVPPTQYSSSMTFGFDSGSRSTIPAAGAMAGTGPTRTCAPNGAAERAILDGIARALRGQ